jgi:hypothetical protein
VQFLSSKPVRPAEFNPIRSCHSTSVQSSGCRFTDPLLPNWSSASRL